MKKIYNKIKLIVVMILIGIIIGMSTLNVSAASQTIYLGQGVQLHPLIGGVGFPTKVTTSGDLVYCLNIHKHTSKNTIAYLVGEMDAGFAYLIQNGYPNKSYSGNAEIDYYITQTAIWWYLDETTGTHNLNSSFKETASDPYSIRPVIKSLVFNAKKAKAIGYQKPTMNISLKDANLKLSSDAKYYVSDTVTVNSNNVNEYNVTLENAPAGSIITDTNNNSKTTFAKNEKFIVKVPASKITDINTKIKVKVTAKGVINKAYEYRPADSNMQNCTPAVLEPEVIPVTNEFYLGIISSKVTIIKLDRKTDKALAGAELVLKDFNGKEIARWTSTINNHIIRNLPNGKYTVEEIKAPEGYEKLTKPLEFTITDSRKNIIVKLYNDAKTNVVTITKVDAETKNILPGATLVVKDATGKEIAKFESTTAPYVLTGLANGKYTVEEIKAPEGYRKSDDIVEITIDDKHSSYQVNFYNYKEVIVPNTASSNSIIMIIIGSIIVISAVGFIYKYEKK